LTNCVGLESPLLVGRHLLVFTHHASISIPSFFFKIIIIKFNNGIRLQPQTQIKLGEKQMVIKTNGKKDLGLFKGRTKQYTKTKELC
jgi:hypothetical protein